MKKAKSSQRHTDKGKQKKKTAIRGLLVLECLIAAVVVWMIVKPRFSAQETETGDSGKELEERLTSASMDHSAWIVDGKLKLAGEAYEDQETVSSWKNLVQVSISDDHILALDQDGRVYAAGSDSNLQCEINGLEDVCYIEAGERASLAVMEDGSIEMAGIIDEDWREGLEAETQALEVSVGGSHVAVLRKDGTVSAYGENAGGQCAVDGWTSVCRISAGNDFTVGLTGEGKVLFAGDTASEAASAAAWEDISLIDAGGQFVAGTDKDGNALAAGQNTQGQCNLESWKNILSLSAGYDHTIAICGDGALYAAGFNGSGQCDVK